MTPIWRKVMYKVPKHHSFWRNILCVFWLFSSSKRQKNNREEKVLASPFWREGKDGMGLVRKIAYCGFRRFCYLTSWWRMLGDLACGRSPQSVCGRRSSCPSSLSPRPRTRRKGHRCGFQEKSRNRTPASLLFALP